MTKERINHARTSFYQAEKPRPITAPPQALSAGISASQTTRKDSLAMLLKKVKLPNSTLAVSFSALINESFALAI